jgi:hypothetical protein
MARSSSIDDVAHCCAIASKFGLLPDAFKKILSALLMGGDSIRPYASTLCIATLNPFKPEVPDRIVLGAALKNWF